MAAKYSLLPSEVLSRATTLDLQFHLNAEVIGDRERKKARGESIADTYTQTEIENMYNKFKGRNSDVQS